MGIYHQLNSCDHLRQKPLIIILEQLISNVILDLFLFYFNMLCTSHLAKQMVWENQVRRFFFPLSQLLYMLASAQLKIIHTRLLIHDF